jgi:hypothetical protein
MEIAVIRKMILAGVVAFSIGAHADPIVFQSVRVVSETAVFTTGSSDFDSSSSPPLPLPLVSTSSVADATGAASATATGNIGLLTTDVSAEAQTGFGLALASSQFTGTFFGGGPLHPVVLFFNFNTASTSSGDAFAFGTLFITVTANSQTLVSQGFDSSRSGSFSLSIPTGVLATLDVLLMGQSLLIMGGSAENLSSVAFQGVIPLPGTLSLLLLGLLAVGIARSRR